MKVRAISLVLFIALVSENQSLKVHRNDQTDLNSLTRQPHHHQQRQARDRQTVANNVATDPVTTTNIGQQQQVVANTLQNNYGYSGGDGQDSSSLNNYYYPVQQQQQQQQQVQTQQQPQQQYQVQQPQLQPQQYYNPYYYPQPHPNFLYPDKTRRQGPMNGGQDDGGILGHLSGLFSGVFDMLGMSDDDDQHHDPNGGGDDGGLGGGLGGIGGGLGGAGLGFLKGKKLGWLGSGLLGLILSPIILPIIALWIAAIVLIIYFIPIPVIDPANMNQGGGRGKWRSSSRLYSPVQDTMRLARSVLQSDQCVERMSCEIARVAKSYNLLTPDWIQRKMDSFDNKWVHRVSRSFKAVRGGSDCKQYSCPTIMSPFQKIRSIVSTSRSSPPSASSPAVVIPVKTKTEGTKKSP